MSAKASPFRSFRRRKIQPNRCRTEFGSRIQEVLRFCVYSTTRSASKQISPVFHYFLFMLTLKRLLLTFLPPFFTNQVASLCWWLKIISSRKKSKIYPMWRRVSPRNRESRYGNLSQKWNSCLNEHVIKAERWGWFTFRLGDDRCPWPALQNRMIFW